MICFVPAHSSKKEKRKKNCRDNVVHKLIRNTGKREKDVWALCGIADCDGESVTRREANRGRGRGTYTGPAVQFRTNLAGSTEMTSGLSKITQLVHNQLKSGKAAWAQGHGAVLS